MKKIDLDTVLVHPMLDNDAGADTVADYLHSLLWKLWQEGEGFSGKRPFGNSVWECDLYVPLIAGEFIEGELDEDGYVNWCDEGTGNDLIFQCIDHVFKTWRN